MNVMLNLYVVIALVAVCLLDVILIVTCLLFIKQIGGMTRALSRIYGFDERS